MKTLLIQSYLGGREPLVFPLGLACIKSALTTGHDVRMFDTNTSEKPFEDLRWHLKSFVPDVVAISLRNIDSTNKRKVFFYYKYLRNTIDTIKSYSGAKIVIGGSGFSIYAKEIMEDEPRIDYGVYLEGENVFSSLLENLNTPEKVTSVYYRKNGRVRFSGPQLCPNLNRLNIPDRAALPLDKYSGYKDSIGVETKRGCMLRCIYCVYPFLNGRTYRLRDPALVADDIEDLVTRHGVKRFMFVDSVFNIPKKHAKAICLEIIKRGLRVKWSAWFNEKQFNRELLELVKEAGCDNVMLSPDAFSDNTLSKLGKNIKKADIKNAYQILKEIGGLEISYNFFKNPPGQNLRNIISIALFCIKAKLELRDKIHFEFNSLRIEPYTKLYDIAVSEGIMKKEENLLFPKYYTNKKTWYIGKVFDALLRLKGK